jgi:1,4-alpha-glucan branching enzyme
MPRRFRPLRWLALAALLAVPAPPAHAASADNNVEWAGVSHLAFMDRRPLCPLNGETFQVRFQSWHFDLTAASVHVVAGASTTDVPAVWIGRRGPYDIWAAQVPATASLTESYYIALTDGATTDYLSPAGMSHSVPADAWALDFTTLAHAPAGATPTSTGGAVFKVWAPNAGVSSVQVRGAFNSWLGTSLTRVGEYWIGRHSTVADRAEYKFYIPTQPNNSHYCPDPYARGLNAPGNYNATVENPFRFAWTDSAFQSPAPDSLVLYQLHVGTFCGLNDPVGATAFPSGYRDVAARVGHLRDLGVNAVMLNPITEFPGDNSAGYNPITQWSPEWKYGTPDDFKYLVNTLHANGIAVVLDIVWNHVSPTDNFMWNYDGFQEWFETPDQQTDWGSQAAFGKTAVADYYANSAHYWFGEYHLDGFRMDATSAMTAGVHSASGWALMQRLNNEKANRWADKITIAEQLPSYLSYTQPTSAGGAGFDAQYQMLWRDNLRGAILAAASGDPSMNNVRSALVGSGPYISGTRAVNYVQLHDEAWPSSGGQRLVKTIDPIAPSDDVYAQGRSKLVEGLTILSQGIPAILMGDEFLESTDFGAESVNRIDWSKKTTYAPVLHYFQRLFQVRRKYTALRASASMYVSHVNEAGNVIGFRRYDASGNSIMVIANFSNTDYAGYRLGVPAAGDWTELANSQDPQYNGSGPVNSGNLPADAVFYDGYAQSLAISLPKMALVVLAPAAYAYAGVPAAAAPGTVRLSAPWPNPSGGPASVSFELPRATRGTVRVHDLAGRVVSTLAGGELAPGAHRVQWNGTDARGRAVSPGLYFVRLRTELGSATTRLVIAR